MRVQITSRRPHRSPSPRMALTSRAQREDGPRAQTPPRPSPRHRRSSLPHARSVEATAAADAATQVEAATPPTCPSSPSPLACPAAPRPQGVVTEEWRESAPISWNRKLGWLVTIHVADSICARYFAICASLFSSSVLRLFLHIQRDLF